MYLASRQKSHRSECQAFLFYPIFFLCLLSWSVGRNVSPSGCFVLHFILRHFGFFHPIFGSNNQ